MARLARLCRLALRALLALLAVLAITLLVVKLVWGGGEPYPDVSTAPRLDDASVEARLVHDLPLGNVACAPGHRVFFNTHPFAQAHRFRDATVFELVDGAPRPYPSLEAQEDLRFVFGMTVDRQGRLWMIAPATLDRERTRLVAFDLATDERVVDHHFEPGVARFAQDLRVDPDGRTLYLADTGAFRFTDAALLVVDTGDWSVRRVLDGHASTQPQGWTIRTAHGPHRVGWGLLTFSVGVDGIALSADGAWLYFATMSHDTLFRIPTAALRDPGRSDAELEAALEEVGPKPLSDGIELMPDGTVLSTDIENGGVAAVDPSGELETWVKRDDVVWADGIARCPDGEVLFTDSAIPAYLHPLLLPPDRETLAAHAPYALWAFTP